MKRINSLFATDLPYAGADDELPLIDLSNGGQFSYVPDLRAISSDVPFVRRNLQAFLLTHPPFFERISGQTKKLVATLKNLIENRAQRIEGVQSTLKSDWDERKVGGAGEVFEYAINTTIERTTPQFVWGEVGKVRNIQRFLEFWHTVGTMDPNTKNAGITHYTSDNLQTYMEDEACATVVFVEPDITGRFVSECWVSTALRPKTYGAKEGMFDKTGSLESLEINCEMTAVTINNRYTRTLGQMLLNEALLEGFDPQRIPLNNDQLSAAVSSANVGYTSRINEIGALAN